MGIAQPPSDIGQSRVQLSPVGLSHAILPSAQEDEETLALFGPARSADVVEGGVEAGAYQLRAFLGLRFAGDHLSLPDVQGLDAHADDGVPHRPDIGDGDDEDQAIAKGEGIDLFHRAF